jgi:putative ABC transport system permease protein
VYTIVVALILAQRNVLRQWRRSAFALSANIVGVAALMLAGGFIEWNFMHYREAMINSQLGHIRIHKAGFTESGSARPFAYLLPEVVPPEIASDAVPGLLQVAPRLSLSGMLSHGENTLPFIGEGMDAAAEIELSRSLLMVKGQGMTASDPKGVILGEGLASNLGVGVGDTVVMLVTTSSGGVNAMEMHVRGLFSSVSKAYDDMALRMPIQAARQLLRVHGAHTWVLLLDDTRRTEEVLRALHGRLGTGTYEVVPWWELSDFYNKSEALFAKQATVMRLIVGLLIVLSISNTLTMTVVERTGEIGTSMALGVSRTAVLGRFLAEGLVIGVVGASLGMLAGWGLAMLVSAIGIPVPPPPGMAHGYTSEILVTPELAASAAILAAGTTILASLYPAWKASRMEIVDALRRNRA